MAKFVEEKKAHGFVVEAYYHGLQDVIDMIERGMRMGLNLKESFDCAKSSVEKTREK